MNSVLIKSKVELYHFRPILGCPSRTIEAGGPAPAGYRSNLVHLFDDIGVYLTEHHATCLIESINFVFETSESIFAIAQPFAGSVTVCGVPIVKGMEEAELPLTLCQRYLAGRYEIAGGQCTVSIRTEHMRTARRRRSRKRYVTSVSVSLGAAQKRT